MEEIKQDSLKQEIKTVAQYEEKLIEDKTGAHFSEEELLKRRKEKVIKFLKTRYDWIVYIILAFIVWMAVRIRTLNLSKLKDITTGGWTLGPDLDPFLFLRWAKYIVEHGSLFAIDKMRYVPLGFNVRGELLLHPYMMAYFHKIAVFFGSTSVTQSAVIYPVFMFALTVIAFFLFTRKIFIKTLGEKQASIIALVSCFFLSVIPVLLPRTIAGIPEKESVGFLFLFLSFYLFLSAWEAKKFRSGIILGMLAGASTAGMSLVWGGSMFIFLGIGPAAFFAFLLGKMNRDKLWIYGVWILSSFALMSPFSSRFGIKDLFTSYVTGSVAVIWAVSAFHIFVFEPYLKNKFSSGKLSKIPTKILSTVIVTLGIMVFTSVILGPSFITSQINGILGNIVSPSGTRLLLTVAENKQPYFIEWSGSFGPIVKGIPLFFWLFFFGSIYLSYKMTSGVLTKKERLLVALSYSIFLFSLVFSRYSPSSTLNGTNFISIFIYAAGFLLFLGSLGYYYYLYHKKGHEGKLRDIEIGLILLFVFFFFSILAARSAVRTIMVLVPSASIIASYLAVAIFNDLKKIKDGTLKAVAWVIFGLIALSLIYSGLQFYAQINSESANYAPSIYTQQWQKAMAWVRENTSEDAVFGHWWDYGYWLQSIGERATVLDGGNGISYWNHLMGRYALTGEDDRAAMEFLYAHNGTHFLIDSTDIGKYAAFSSIGSDPGYDRRSWIPTFLKDDKQTQETKNSTIALYGGGTALDEDLVYEYNGSKIFLPGGKAGVGAVLVEKNSLNEIINQPIGIFVYQNQQYRLPLRYIFYNNRLIDFGSGIEAGAFIFPRVDQNGNQVNIVKDGAMLYLSKRTVMSQLAKLYLYGEETRGFKLVHSEDDLIVSQLKAQNPNVGEFVYFGGLRGPIKIWQIDYPSDIKLNKYYLQIYYPEDELIQ